jgi:hypothetical protein
MKSLVCGLAGASLLVMSASASAQPVGLSNAQMDNVSAGSVGDLLWLSDLWQWLVDPHRQCRSGSLTPQTASPHTASPLVSNAASNGSRSSTSSSYTLRTSP